MALHSWTRLLLQLCCACCPAPGLPSSTGRSHHLTGCAPPCCCSVAGSWATHASGGGLREEAAAAAVSGGGGGGSSKGSGLSGVAAQCRGPSRSTHSAPPAGSARQQAWRVQAWLVRSGVRGAWSLLQAISDQPSIADAAGRPHEADVMLRHAGRHAGGPPAPRSRNSHSRRSETTRWQPHQTTREAGLPP